jgi:hypothetical protein
MKNLVIIKVYQSDVIMYLLTSASFRYVELSYLDYAYYYLVYYMDNGSNPSAFNTLGYDADLALLLLSGEKNSKLTQYCKKHNIRKIHIRCLSDLLQASTSLRFSSNEVQQFSWATYFNADCTFSSHKFQYERNCHRTNLTSVRKRLYARMIELDESLYEACCAYKGRISAIFILYVSLNLHMYYIIYI